MMKAKTLRNIAAATALFSVLSFCPGKTKPILDDEYFARQEKVMFLPGYSLEQPNIVVIETTKLVREWMRKNGFEKEKVQPNFQTAEELTRKVYAEKNMDFVEMPLKKYMKEIKGNPKRVASPDDFLNLNTPVCLEKSVFLTAVLRELGLNAQVFLLEYKTDTAVEYVRHVFVVANARNEKIILDPANGIIEKSAVKFKNEIAKKLEIEGRVVEVRLYPLLPYKTEYEKYLKSDKAELELDEEFKSHKRQVD